MYVDLHGRRVPFQALESSSFAGFLSSYAPQLLPGRSSPRTAPGASTNPCVPRLKITCANRDG